MFMNCEQLSVYEIFKKYPRLKIPKYQRGYAWKKIQIDDFIADLRECFKKRKDGEPIPHFFGGIVSIEAKEKTDSTNSLEIIDGQQRLTTFILLIAQIVQKIYDYVKEFDSELKQEQKERLYKFANGLKYTYLYQKDEYSIVVKDELKLIPTITDSCLFREVLEGKKLQKGKDKRDSQNNIIDGCKYLREFVGRDIVNYKKYNFVLDNLDTIRKVLEEDCKLISITLEDHISAYQCFQVLNNRGTPLTTGNLLKSDTLRHLDENGFVDRIDDVAMKWNCILKGKPEEVERTLQAIYVSRTGKRPSRLKFPEEFMTSVFNIDNIKKNAKFGQRLERIIQEVCDEAQTIDSLRDGEWIPDDYDAKECEKERLRSLILYLKQRMVMPLLLSFAKKCEPNEFYEAVTIIERVICRYINIQKLRPNIIETVIRENAYNIYNGEYSKHRFRDDLKEFFSREVNDHLFRTSLNELRYGKGGINENVLRTIFGILEIHWAWGSNGIGDEPLFALDANVAELSESKIEYVYPKVSSKFWKDKELERSIDNLGNLVILRTKELNKQNSDTFKDRRKAYRKTDFESTRIIADYEKWTLNELEDRQEELITRALRIFQP